jgi:hypothetical protein
MYGNTNNNNNNNNNPNMYKQQQQQHVQYNQQHPNLYQQNQMMTQQQYGRNYPAYSQQSPYNPQQLYQQQQQQQQEAVLAYKQQQQRQASKTAYNNTAVYANPNPMYTQQQQQYIEQQQNYNMNTFANTQQGHHQAVYSQSLQTKTVQQQQQQQQQQQVPNRSSQIINTKAHVANNYPLSTSPSIPSTPLITGNTTLMHGQAFTVYQQQPNNTKRPNSIGSSPLSVASSMSSSSPHSVIDSELGSPSTTSASSAVAHNHPHTHNANTHATAYTTASTTYDYNTIDDNLEYLLQELNLYGFKELPDLTIVINDLEIFLQT